MSETPNHLANRLLYPSQRLGLSLLFGDEHGDARCFDRARAKFMNKNNVTLSEKTFLDITGSFKKS